MRTLWVMLLTLLPRELPREWQWRLTIHIHIHQSDGAALGQGWGHQLGKLPAHMNPWGAIWHNLGPLIGFHGPLNGLLLGCSSPLSGKHFRQHFGPTLEYVIKSNADHRDSLLNAPSHEMHSLRHITETEELQPLQSNSNCFCSLPSGFNGLARSSCGPLPESTRNSQVSECTCFTCLLPGEHAEGGGLSSGLKSVGLA